MKSVRFTNQILVISGSVVELYTYHVPVRIDPLPQSVMRTPHRDDQLKKEQREDSSVYRSRKRLKRLLNANAGMHFQKNGQPFMPIFITLTFRENMTDIKAANYHYSKFIQRFNYFLLEEKRNRLKYVVAIEFQKRGAVHYHAVFFNLPFREGMKTDVEELWGQGFTKVKAIYDMKDLGNYVMKYISKEHFDNRLVGKKCYFSSRNLRKSVEIKESAKVKVFMGIVPLTKNYERNVEATEYSPGYLYEKFTAENIDSVRSFLDLFVKHGYFDSKL